MEFAVHFLIRKGIGPDYVPHVITVGLDDIDPETTDQQILDMAKWEAEQELYRSDDYKHYGKNWIYKDTIRI